MDFCAESVTLLDCVLLQFYFTLNTPINMINNINLTLFKIFILPSRKSHYTITTIF